MPNVGAYPLNPDSPVGQLRAILRDTDATPLDPPIDGAASYAVFSDADLSAALTLAGESVFRAAAHLIKGLALEYAAQERSIRTDDLALDLKGRGKTLLEVAKSFMDDADADDAAGADDFFQVVALPSSARHCIRPEGTPRPIC